VSRADVRPTSHRRLVESLLPHANGGTGCLASPAEAETRLVPLLDIRWRALPRAIEVDTADLLPGLDPPRARVEVPAEALGRVEHDAEFGWTLRGPGTSSLESEAAGLVAEAWVRLANGDAGTRLTLLAVEIAGHDAAASTVRLDGEGRLRLSGTIAVQAWSPERVGLDVHGPTAPDAAAGPALLRVSRLDAAPPVVWARSVLPAWLGWSGGQYELAGVECPALDPPR